MYYLGVDVGSVSTDFVVTDENLKVVDSIYLRTMGNPAKAIKTGLKELSEKYQDKEILGVGVTGSGRALAGHILGADIIKNEITTHAVAAATIDPAIQTVLEIGGQDSKIILLRDGILSDFAMNTVCAAGTGSFLDRQAERMGMEIGELGSCALKSENPVQIAGRCAVFAESDIIHKQQMGCSESDIAAGMSKALVRNYLSNVAKGKELRPIFCFQGGVAANEGIRKAFEEELGYRVFVPEEHKVMGAFGAAILASEGYNQTFDQTKFRGFETAEEAIQSKGFICEDCSNHCEVTALYAGEEIIGHLSDKCGKYQNVTK